MDDLQARHQGKRVALINIAPSQNTQGGAERFYAGLVRGFQEIGCETSEIWVDAPEPDFDTIIENYEKLSKLDLSGYDIVVSAKAPAYAIKHQCHVVYLMHTVRAFDDLFDKTFTQPRREHFMQRWELQRRDFEALRSCKARFSIGYEVSRRLYRWCGLSSEVLHPPLQLDGFRSGKDGDYFFLPGRLHPWKRIDLVISAVRQSQLPLKLIIAGTGEDENRLKDLAAGDERIIFIGRVEDEQLIELYANCLAVPFVPYHEDYGYVTLEAHASGKPVLTCSDSGEPCQFVVPYETGLIVKPSVKEIRVALEWFFENRPEAKKMGAYGKMRLQKKNMSWEQTASVLAASALGSLQSAEKEKSRACILDMQPITPPVGGGRLRLLGLYHHLGGNLDCTYVGSYDWPGEVERKIRLSETLLEMDIPLSDEHHSAAQKLANEAGGKIVIDLAFSQQALLSPKYVSVAQAQAADSDIVIFSHPWVYPLLCSHLRPNQLVVYDSQNVEGFLRAQILDEKKSLEYALLRNVVRDENDLGWAADWIFACSHEDLLRFNRLYGFPAHKMRVVPNGVMAFRDPLPTSESKIRARKNKKIGLDEFVAIFIGSAYGPNVQAAKFIIDELAVLMPDVLFILAGGVGNSISSSAPNVYITGGLDEAEKTVWLHTADVAINPMRAGSGTNIKMFDFMAMGLPVVTTAVGARGIEYAGAPPFVLAPDEPAGFADAIRQLRLDPVLCSRIGQAGRRCVEDGYAWERISPQVGRFLTARKQRLGQPAPRFSVIVPTYERHGELDILAKCLSEQIDRDFEVIIVDQSLIPWYGADEDYGFPLIYFHTPVRGAVRARNTGAMLAQGDVLVFVDDDCRPENDWLLNARRYFLNDKNVGIEGCIYSDKLHDPDWRPVTNIGFEGLGFMTANLFVRSSVFQYLGGFDLQFDMPHFREDTDLGWRMQEVGLVPYAEDVRVFHPAQPRAKERESKAERVKFFRKDALLYKKHPEKYRRLYMAERHFVVTDGFKENVISGFKDMGIEMPEWMRLSLK